MSGLVGTLLAGGGTLLAIAIMVYLWMRGGGGRIAMFAAFAAGSVLGIAGILWGVVLIGVRAGGEVVSAVLRAANGIGGIILGWPW